MAFSEEMPHFTKLPTSAPATTPATAPQFTPSVTLLSLPYLSRLRKKSSMMMAPTGGSVAFRKLSQPQKLL